MIVKYKFNNGWGDTYGNVIIEEDMTEEEIKELVNSAIIERISVEYKIPKEVENE